MEEHPNASQGDDAYRKGLLRELQAMGPIERLAHFSTVREAATRHVGETIHAALLAGMSARDVRAAIRWPHAEVRSEWLLWVHDLADAGGLPPLEDLYQASLRLLAERELYSILLHARRELPAGMVEEVRARVDLIEAWERTMPERIEPFRGVGEDQAAAAE